MNPFEPPQAEQDTTDQLAWMRVRPVNSAGVAVVSAELAVMGWAIGKWEVFAGGAILVAIGGALFVLAIRKRRSGS